MGTSILLQIRCCTWSRAHLLCFSAPTASTPFQKPVENSGPSQGAPEWGAQGLLTVLGSKAIGSHLLRQGRSTEFVLVPGGQRWAADDPSLQAGAGSSDMTSDCDTCPVTCSTPMWGGQEAGVEDLCLGVPGAVTSRLAWWARLGGCICVLIWDELLRDGVVVAGPLLRCWCTCWPCLIAAVWSGSGHGGFRMLGRELGPCPPELNPMPSDPKKGGQRPWHAGSS